MRKSCPCSGGEELRVTACAALGVVGHRGTPAGACCAALRAPRAAAMFGQSMHRSRASAGANVSRSGFEGHAINHLHDAPLVSGEPITDQVVALPVDLANANACKILLAKPESDCHPNQSAFAELACVKHTPKLVTGRERSDFSRQTVSYVARLPVPREDLPAALLGGCHASAPRQWESPLIVNNAEALAGARAAPTIEARFGGVVRDADAEHRIESVGRRHAPRPVRPVTQKTKNF